MNVTEKLDRAYEYGVIAFVSACDILIPIRERGDIRETAGHLEIHFRGRWLAVRPELIKFVRHH